MPNAKDGEISPFESIFAIGEIGSGKTSQIPTLPGRKFAYLFDPNAMRTLKGFDLDYEEFRVDAMDLDLSIQSLKKKNKTEYIRDKPSRQKIEPVTYIKWEEDFETKLEAGFFKDYDWLIFDSMTTFSDIVMDRIQYLNGRLGKHPEQGDYTGQMTTIRNVFRAAHGAGLNLYATGHIDLRQDELSKTVTNQIMLTGRLRTQIPLLFAQVLAFFSDKDTRGPVFKMLTFPDRRNPKVRCTFKDVSFVEDITIDWSKDPIGQGLSRFL